ncbi:MAG: zinc-binding dehydrogenase [Candidatus Aminicenantales bacterium]
MRPSSRRPYASTPSSPSADLRALARVIDKRYAVTEIPEAIRYMAEGHARGKVVIVLDQTGKA